DAAWRDQRRFRRPRQEDSVYCRFWSRGREGAIYSRRSTANGGHDLQAANDCPRCEGPREITTAMPGTLIYHITSGLEAEAARKSGEYVPRDFERDGFIHCSYAHQVADVAKRLFSGRSDLVLLEISPDRLDCEVVDENLEGGSQLFPHIYGRLKMSAVVAIHDFQP